MRFCEKGTLYLLDKHPTVAPVCDRGTVSPDDCTRLGNVFFNLRQKSVQIVLVNVNQESVSISHDIPEHAACNHHIGLQLFDGFHHFVQVVVPDARDEKELHVEPVLGKLSNLEKKTVVSS